VAAVSGELRLFWAVRIPAPVKAGLAAVQDRLKKAGADVKWVEPENFHLTVRFLGAVAPDRVEVITCSVRRAAATLASFELRLSGGGAFPGAARPRVLWVAVNGDVGQMIQLHRQVEAVLKPLGFPPEGNFTPHLTLGRVRSPQGTAALTPLIEKMTQGGGEAGAFTVERLCLMESRLTRLGPHYTVLREVALGGAG
jgi:2'-5' RNA ligase